MLELHVNNVFSTGTVTVFENGEKVLFRDKLTLDMFVNFQYHPVIQGDELTALAYKYYNTVIKDASKYWWVIADVNELFNPFSLEDYVGKRIVIPDVSEVKLIVESLNEV